MDTNKGIDVPTLAALVLVPLYVVAVLVVHAVWPSGEPTPVVHEPTITFVGDMMFDRYIRERAEVHGYARVLTDTTNLFADTDILVGNLEGPITTFTPVSDWREGGPNHYTFTFATTVAQALGDAGFNAVVLSNNHSMNFGQEGLQQTKEHLSSAGVDYIGVPDDVYTPWRDTLGHGSVVVYPYSTRYSSDTEKLLESIRREDMDAFVVVYAHWGDEYETLPNRGQRNLAHRFVDAGADLVVGAHPHVVQSKEQYKDAWIYYSLGNFVFDQYFDDKVSCGLVLSVTPSGNGMYTTSESFIELMRDGTTKVSDCMTDVPVL